MLDIPVLHLYVENFSASPLSQERDIEHRELPPAAIFAQHSVGLHRT